MAILLFRLLTRQSYRLHTIDGKRIETVEVSLTTLKVVQSRGLCNSNTEYHDRIIRLVEDNAGLIRQRMKAA